MFNNECPIIVSLKQYMTHIKHVQIDTTHINTFIQSLNVQELTQENEIEKMQWWNQGLNGCIKQIPIEQQANAVFIISLLNFNFWNLDNTPYGCHYNNQLYTGYWSLLAGLLTAVQNKINIFDFNYLNSNEFQLSTLKQIFPDYYIETTDIQYQIPLIEIRFRILKEASSVITNNYGGNISNLIIQCKYDCLQVLQALSVQFKSLNDQNTIDIDNLSLNNQIQYVQKFETQMQYNQTQKQYENVINQIYDKQQQLQYSYNQQFNTQNLFLVKFFKRAQIFLAELHFSQIINLQNTQCLTIFADYRVPQILNSMGILQYDTFLTDIIQKENHLMQNGSVAEVEIRASSILAVHCIQDFIQKQHGFQVKQVTIDFLLWNQFKIIQNQQQQQNETLYGGQKTPMHRVLGWFY